MISAAEAKSTVAVTGTVGGSVHAGDTVTLTVDNQTFTGTVAANGTSYSINVPGSALAEGTSVSASVTTANAAGSHATASASQTYDIDTAVDKLVDAAGAAIDAASGAVSAVVQDQKAVTSDQGKVEDATEAYNKAADKAADAQSHLATDNAKVTSLSSQLDAAQHVQTAEAAAENSHAAPTIANFSDTKGDLSKVIMSGDGNMAGDTITVKDASGTLVGTAVVQANLSWSLDVTHAATAPTDINVFFHATETYADGRTSAASTPTQYWHGDWTAAQTEATDDNALMNASNNTIYVTSNDHNARVLIDGGLGNDTAILDVSSRDVTVTQDAAKGELIITTHSGEAEVFRNVENFQFTDTTKTSATLLSTAHATTDTFGQTDAANAVATATADGVVIDSAHTASSVVNTLTNQLADAKDAVRADNKAIDALDTASSNLQDAKDALATDKGTLAADTKIAGDLMDTADKAVTAAKNAVAVADAHDTASTTATSSKDSGGLNVGDVLPHDNVDLLANLPTSKSATSGTTGDAHEAAAAPAPEPDVGGMAAHLAQLAQLLNTPPHV